MKLRFVAPVVWLLAFIFATLVSPAIQSQEFKDLIESNKTIRVSARVETQVTEYQGFNGTTERQVEIRVLEPAFLAGKTGLVSIGEREISLGQSIDAVMTFRESHRSDVAFRARIKSLFGTASGDQPNFFENLRKEFTNNLRGLTSDSAALVAGLAIGDDSRLSGETKDSFKTVSLTHLTAVSGANCAIVLGVVALLINRLPLKRWQRVLLSLLAIAFYLALVGPEPSVLRASVMVAVVLVGFNLGRKVNPVDALALSVILLLLFDPKLSLDYGFALSVLATLGILVLASKFVEVFERRMPKWLAIGLAVTVAAQIACLPILLVLQPEIPVYSVIANLLAEPLVIPITILGLAACMICLIFPMLSGSISLLASIPASWIIALANYLAEAPYASLPWYSGALGIVLAVILTFAVFFWFISRSSRLKYLSASAVVLIVAGFLAQNSAAAVSNSAFYSEKHTIVNCDVGQGDALVLQSQGKVAVIDVGRENPAIDNCLTGLGISKIDLLVLTHFDMDHVGGILGAITGRSVGIAMVSPFPDERPGADFAERAVADQGIELIQAEVGMNGRLGDFAWQVLAPHRGAPEAKDSNDGSIAMLWESEATALFTLADLGEEGQLRIGQESSAILNAGFDAKTVVVKVAHHGSADQAAEFYEAIQADVAIISVGQHNSYGHPTKRTLDLLDRLNAKIFRTDEQGAIGLTEADSGLTATISGRS